MGRPTAEEYFMNLARTAATRGTCNRGQVGCVIVVDGDIVATGYAGSVRGAPHCADEGCDMLHGHCVRTVHAEINALCRAARHGVRLQGGMAFVTHEPCRTCTYALINAGVVRIYYAQRRPDDTAQAQEDRPRVFAAAQMTGVQIYHLP